MGLSLPRHQRRVITYGQRKTHHRITLAVIVNDGPVAVSDEAADGGFVTDSRMNR